MAAVVQFPIADPLRVIRSQIDSFLAGPVNDQFARLHHELAHWRESLAKLDRLIAANPAYAAEFGDHCASIRELIAETERVITESMPFRR